MIPIGEHLYIMIKNFSQLVLDLNQAGLSWATILNKQENFYEAFDNFEIEKVALYDEVKEEELYKMQG